MIFLLNNRDSFVYNLRRYFEELGRPTELVASDAITIEEIEDRAPTALVISPGPCTPNEAGLSLEAISHFSGRLPILGVCLGHQAIGQVFGGTVREAEYPVYGQAREVSHSENDLFAGLPNPLTVGLYHSLVVADLDDSPLCVQARSPGGEIMALRHQTHDTFGVQFHPESILSASGHALLHNFVKLAETPS